MEPFAFLSKLLSATSRVGAILVLAGLVTFLGRSFGFDFFVNLDPLVYQIVVVAGVIGSSVVVVDFLTSAWGWTSTKVKVRRASAREARIKQEHALKNLRPLPAEYADVLSFLRANNCQRFPASADNDLLWHLRQAGFLEIDDPNWHVNSSRTYYLVPDYVWDAIATLPDNHPPKDKPPWIREPDPQGWMR
ncbi:MAG: hypothetical protein FJX44_07880 [Alphaproteobacteria bacterium]|nr:hypothetical protein [Alphaproteobacteria bacterium]